MKKYSLTIFIFDILKMVILMKRAEKKKTKKQLLNQPQYKIANTRMKRFFAMIIDWYLTTMIAAIPITFFLRTDNTLSPDLFDFSRYPVPTATLLIIYGILVGMIYYIIIPMYIWKGQTLGKKICKIVVTDEQGNDITLRALLLREMIGSTFLEGGIVITASYLRKFLPLLGLSTLVNPLKYIAYALTFISIVYAYFNPLSQSFHDKIAKTIVINK